MNINEIDFRGIDLNLLLAFAALMRERSVTRAAERLYLGQPAMSAALNRLRELFKDELFVRTPRGMVPTARAHALAERLEPALVSIHGAVFETPRFAAKSATQTFRIGAADILEATLLPDIIARLEREAPGVRVTTRSVDAAVLEGMLDDGEIDVGLGLFGQVPTRHRRQVLMQSRYVCVFADKRTKLKAPITLAQYLSSPHVIVSFRGDLEGTLDATLGRLKKRRNVVFATPHFVTLPFVLKRTNTIATLPEFAVQCLAEPFRLAASKLPFATEPIIISMVWHARFDVDPAHAWMRTLLAEEAERVTRSTEGSK